MTGSVTAAKAEALAAGSAERSELAASETDRWDTSARANARRWLQSKVSSIETLGASVDDTEESQGCSSPGRGAPLLGLRQIIAEGSERLASRISPPGRRAARRARALELTCTLVKDRGPLGLSLHSLPCGGVAVGSSARSAVVRPGDTITEVNGVPVMSVEQAAAALHAVAPGGDIVIALIRLEGTKRPSSDHLREDRICL